MTTISLEATAFHKFAIDAAMWGTPIVSFDAMRQAFFRDAGAQYGDVTYLSRFADSDFLVTTPNASTRYVYLNFNTRDGPIVLEIPQAIGAGLFGSILDAWQVPLADVGPQGVDQGRGGKYLVLPPGHRGGVPARYIPVPASTFNGYAMFRAISEDSSEAAVSRALRLVKQLKVYRVAREDDPPPTRAIDISGKLFDGLMHYDNRFYASLAKMVDEEPALPRDAAMLETLKGLGIEKGRPFAPDPAMRSELKGAAQEALALLVQRESQEGLKFWPNTGWRTPSTIGARTAFTFVTDDGVDVKSRAQTYFMGCAPPKALGKASMYLGAYNDSRGRPLTGDGSYRLRLPANVPAEQFWAMTVYDAESCAFIRNSPKVEVNSYQRGLMTNSDGSIDIYLSADAPAGKEANWIALSPGRRWFPLLRFYGPKRALFDKSWQAPDIEKIAST